MNNKKNIVLGLFVMTALTLGYVSLADASTYQYVNTSGQVSTVVANTPQEALRTAYQLGAHSGVMLVTSSTNVDVGDQVTQGQGSNVYLYINTSGQLSSVMANTPQEALRTAYQLGAHSGVMLK